jgi:hypothetical protein
MVGAARGADRFRILRFTTFGREARFGMTLLAGVVKAEKETGQWFQLLGRSKSQRLS